MGIEHDETNHTRPEEQIAERLTVAATLPHGDSGMLLVTMPQIKQLLNPSLAEESSRLVGSSAPVLLPAPASSP